MIIEIIRRIFGRLYRDIRKVFREKKLKVSWRIRNKHNQTHFGRYWYRDSSVVVGYGTYGFINAINNSDDRLTIGNFCSIAEEVVFLTGADHDIHSVSTFPFKVRYIKSQKEESISKGDIIIQDDVWIGYGATILSGVTIGQGAVVAARTVVNKDVPPYAVVGGVPARVIKYRFAQPVIDFLLTLDYGGLSENLIRSHVEDLYKHIDDITLEEVEKLFSWFPKKSFKKNT